MVLKPALRTARNMVYRVLYRGTGRVCPVCEKRSRRFAPFGIERRNDAMCPHCGSLERHRLLWLFFERHTNLFNGQPKSVLHIAPERCLVTRLRRRIGIGYLTGDLHDRHADVKVDITQIHYPAGYFDVIYCSHVLEHVPDRIRMADEMVRVTRPGGLVYLSYTLWLSPWGGHETSPWHYLGGAYAAERFTRRNGRRPKNDFGRTMYAAHAKEMIRWARAQTGVDVVDLRPRYLPTWMKPVVRVPLLREIVTWNLLIVLRKH